MDSAQLFALRPQAARSWLDLGSGAGFPGLVMAILADQHQPDLAVTLVESDRRKAVFLGEATRKLGLSSKIICERIEDVTPQNADVVSARALSSLSNLCAHVARHANANGMGLFPKGANAAAEILAQIAGTKTLTRQALALAERMGLVVEQKQTAPTLKDIS